MRLEKKTTRLYRHTAYAIILKNAVINGLDHLPQDIEAKIREFLTSHTTSDSAGVAKFIDIDLIHESISDLKPHKAAGHDGVYNEHLIFGGPQLEVHLCLLFNAMLRHSYEPSDFRFGAIKPLLKCKNGDKSNLIMYRGITLAPCSYLQTV